MSRVEVGRSAGGNDGRPRTGRERPEYLALFDIDGTLVRGGPAKEAFRTAMMREFGTTGAIDGHEFSGKTDPQIARELLRGAGRTDEEIDAGFPSLWRHYLTELERRLPARPPEMLPGVEALLDGLSAHGTVALGLVTGNIAPGARLKLGAVGLAGRFQVGAFGSDDEVRDNLPPLAVRRARRCWGVDFPPTRVVVIGDTPRDVACGRCGGHRTVAVATGRVDRSELEAACADHLFDDLSRTNAVIDAVLGPA